MLHSFCFSAAIPVLFRDIGVIGGADGPTSIIVSSVQLRPGALIVTVAVLAVAVIGLYRTRRK